MGREEEGFLAWEDLQALPVIHPFWGGWGRQPYLLAQRSGELPRRPVQVGGTWI